MRLLLIALLSSLGIIWGEEVVNYQIKPATQVATLLEDFALEQVFDVPKEFGSWVALAALPKHGGKERLAAADQYGAIYQIAITGKQVEVTPFPVELSGAHGLLWFEDSLYVVVGEKVERERGVYRAQDLDKDGTFETVTSLKKFNSGGEHGIHSLVPSPDGEWLYLVIGNYTEDSGLEHTLVPQVWDEDHLLTRIPDGRGHARDKMAPGGRVIRFRPDGSEWTYVSTGYRNPFDGAFNEDGEFFVYDADMEWDMGMPWYRPTRLCWAMPGSEYGWRNGSGKWPSYYEDSLPSVVDLGPGSPVGVVSGKGARFPAEFQRSLFCLDWTFATIYAVTIESAGHGYTGEWKEFLTATEALPLTDAIIGSDGHFYFATGGRRGKSSLWRIVYEGQKSTKDAWRPRKKPTGTKEDRFSRYQRRVAAELEGPEALHKLVGQGSRLEQMTSLMGLARVGHKNDRPLILSKLLSLNWDDLNNEERLTWLRTLGLTFIRLGEPTKEEQQSVIDLIDSSYPNPDNALEDELCRMLCYLQAPGVVSRTLALMAEPDSHSDKPDWSRFVERGQQKYSTKVAEVLRELGSPRKIHFAYCLREVKGPWTKGQRQQLMEWYAREEQSKAQKSAQLGLKRMRNETMANATKEERVMIKSWGLEVKSDPFKDLPKAKGPGRAWTVKEITQVASNLKNSDLENGKKMYRATLCSACHRFGAEGGAAGPDLTHLRGRFSIEELAIAILEPNREVSDQYEFSVFKKHDGSTILGRVLDERDEILVVATNPFNFEETLSLSRSDIKETSPSPASPMPGGLVNSLNEEELRDLFAYLLSTQ